MLEATKTYVGTEKKTHTETESWRMYYCSSKCSISWQRLQTVELTVWHSGCPKKRMCERTHRCRNPLNSLKRSSTPISGYWKKITDLYPPVLRWLFGHMPITPGGLPPEIDSFLHHNSDHIISHQQWHHQRVYAEIYGCLNTVSVFCCVYVRGL